VNIDIKSKLIGDDLERAWTLYSRAFSELNALAVQRHLMYRAEFDDVAGDERIQKWVATGPEGQLLGLATYTNELDAWPLISPAYFARRWPVQYAAKTIWYCGFVAVDVAARGIASGTYMEMIAAMYRQAEAGQGIIMLDFCTHNENKRRMRMSIDRALTRLSDGQVGVVQADQQTFMAYLTAA
jgi:hypothetical protein